MSFGERLKHWRTKRGRTLREIGAVLGATPQYVCNLESGRAATIQWAAVQKLADYLDITTDDLRPCGNGESIYRKMPKMRKKTLQK